MPKITNKKKKLRFNLKENLKNKYVAFIDVLGFSNLVEKRKIDSLEDYFTRIENVLDEIKREKSNITSILISDSIILTVPEDIDELKSLFIAIRRIQQALAFKKILLRGAVSYGEVYYNDEKNIIVGHGYIRAFLLEKEAIYPRIIIDPQIIGKLALDKNGFISLINGTTKYNFEDHLIYKRTSYAEIKDDAIFIDYASKIIKKDTITITLGRVYDTIKENLYTEQKYFQKYIWLRDYFKETIQITVSRLGLEPAKDTQYIHTLQEWERKFNAL